MNVCDLTHAYHQTSGGIRTYIDARRRYILEHTEHTHTLVIPGEADRVRRDGRTVTVEVAAPFIPGAEPYRWFSSPRKVRRALAYVAPDVIELGTSYMPTEWPAAFSVRRARRRKGHASIVSVYAHTDFADSYAEGYVSRALGETLGRGAGRLAQVYIKRLFRNADVVAATPAQALMLQKRGIDAASINLGVDVETFAPASASDDVRSALGVPDDALFLVYAGRLDSEKRTGTMVAAAQRANEIRPTVLVLVGEGPHREGLLAEQGGGAPIRVLPYLASKDALARLLASADLYLTAGPYETFGLSVIEAQACGLPVVGVAAGALLERVAEGTGLLGPVDDVEAMTTNILRVAEDRVAMGRASRLEIEERFSWTATFEQMFRLYTAALSHAARH